MTIAKDQERLLIFLQEQDGISNQQLKTALNLADNRYAELIKGLIDSGKVEKFRRRGGGVRLTELGAKDAWKLGPKSAVSKESELYSPLEKSLKSEIIGNDENAIIIDTSSLRKSGKWNNPDLIKIAVRKFELLRKNTLILVTYEVKQWKKWGVESIYEAASHRRFSHESYVVLEWAKNTMVEGLDDIYATCSRFGVGLITLHPYHSKFRHWLQLEAEPNVPSDDDLEDFLGHALKRNGGWKDNYDNLWKNNH